ncbi:MAG: LytTR family DNA-binding domain-containing protein [Allomuricauda sp.]
MNTRCIIVDDEQTPRKILRQYINNTPNLELMKDFWNPIEAIQYVDKNQVEIIFLDIEMPRLKGLDFARIIKNDHHIIFTTAHREFAVEGFELNAADYLLKPFSYSRFLQALDKCNKSIVKENATKIEAIFLKVDKKKVRVNFDELLYIQGMGNYIKLFLSGSNLVVYEKLSSIIEKLPSNRFKRVHNSFIANLTKIQSYTKDYIIINKTHIPVSKTYRDDFLKQIEHL